MKVQWVGLGDKLGVGDGEKERSQGGPKFFSQDPGQMEPHFPRWARLQVDRCEGGRWGARLATFGMRCQQDSHAELLMKEILQRNPGLEVDV